MRTEVRAVLNGGQIAVTTATVLSQRDGECIMEALQRAQDEARADNRPPDVVLTERQFRDLSEFLAESAAWLGCAPA